MKKIKFSTIFSNLKIRPIVSEEKDKYLSIASLNKLKKFLPEIDTESNIDLLPVAFDACVANRVNKNGDVIDGETAAKIGKLFINKPINIEHNRDQVIGCILSYNFSQFGTNEPLSLEEVSATKKPFNITLGGVIWKVVNQELADRIEESNDPTSQNYMTISASWELGFNEYNIIALLDSEKNIENAEIISDPKLIEKYTNDLKAFGGSGKINNKYIYRQVLGKVIPLGIGFTLNPAADVKGVAVKTEEGLNLLEEKEKEEGEANMKESTTTTSEANTENNISQNDNLDVKKERIYMKISKIEEITDALLKEVSAASVTDFIAEEIKKVNDQYLAEKAEKETALKAASDKLETVSKDYEFLKKNLDEVTEKLSTLEAEKAAKAKEETFNARMSSFDEEYDLSNEDREVIAKSIKDLDEKAFEDYKNNASVLMKEKSKAYKKALNEQTQKDAVASKEEAKASEIVEKNSEEVVNQAVDNGTKASTEIPNSVPAAQPSVREKYAKAFSLEGFDIK